MGEMYRVTKLREKRLKKALDGRYFSLWECDFDRAVQQEEDLRDFVKNYEIIPPPLRIRDALAGGRTEPIYTLHECDPSSEQKIRYLDYCVSIKVILLLFCWKFNLK